MFKITHLVAGILIFTTQMRILELRKKTTEILIYGREVLSVVVLSGSAEAA